MSELKPGSATPLVSIILCVRNGMPHVREAVESVRALTYEPYELVIQDGASTDGTLEYLQGLSGFPHLSLVSEADAGQGQGFNRALRRCRAEIITSVDADNLLVPNALEIGVGMLHRHPAAAAVYGACNMIDEENRIIQTWVPAAFDLVGVMEGAIVPPFGCSFFSRPVCGAALQFDEGFPVVPDVDLWLRIGHLPIFRTFEVTTQVRIGRQSSTWQADQYDQLLHYKEVALRRFLAGTSGSRFVERFAARAEAGLALWAVDSMGVIGGGAAEVDRFFAKTAAIDLHSERFRAVVSRVRPRLPASAEGFVEQVYECGIEYLGKRQPARALVYFELLQRSGVARPELPALLEQSRALLREVQRIECDALLQEQQAEVDRRDHLLAETHAKQQAEIARRDQMLREQHDYLQFEIARRNSLLWQLRRLRHEAAEWIVAQFRRPHPHA